MSAFKLNPRQWECLKQISKCLFITYISELILMLFLIMLALAIKHNSLEQWSPKSNILGTNLASLLAIIASNILRKWSSQSNTVDKVTFWYFTGSGDCLTSL